MLTFQLQLEDFNDAVKPDNHQANNLDFFPNSQKKPEEVKDPMGESNIDQDTQLNRGETLKKSKTKVQPEGEKREEKHGGEEEENLKTEEDEPDFITRLGHEPYITFAEFCRYLSLFNPKTGLDEKIQFYFRIFDVGNDKKVDEKDLQVIPP